MSPFLSRRAAAVALSMSASLAAMSPSAKALSFVFTDVSANGGMTAEQLGAFQSAANYWSGKLADPVTVYVNIAFNSLGTNILGSTNSTFATATYADIRHQLVLDQKSSIDAVAVAHLQTGPALSFQATQGDLSSRFDNDGSVNNRLLGLTTANAKALGLSANTSVALPDASITFSTDFVSRFAFSRAGGVPSNKIDFITVAEHELGHALGFSSGVDDIDGCVGPGAPSRCSFNATGSPGVFENDWWYEPLDLFRYSAAGVLDMRVGHAVNFSVDGGSTAIASFSTGEYNGDGSQASHFGSGELNLMRPFVSFGQSYDTSSRDIAAFDAIGWDVAVAVPEPQTYGLMLLGLAVVGGAARRRR